MLANGLIELRRAGAQERSLGPRFQRGNGFAESEEFNKCAESIVSGQIDGDCERVGDSLHLLSQVQSWVSG